MSFEELAHVIGDMSLTAWIMAKSYVWRGKEGLPELKKALLKHFPDTHTHQTAAQKRVAPHYFLKL
jgi:hypothetical protein